jgi:spore coat polysaccharide biosynthesis protein SpsF
VSKFGAIILSRYNSSRLPGKALMQIQGKEILQIIVERLAVVVPLDHIVIATSKEETDDPIAEFASKRGYNCFRGSLQNVAERFFEAANQYNFEYAARINGDNVFVDTEVLAEMINQTAFDYDFITNVHKRTYPKGMSIEIVKLSSYKACLAAISAHEKYYEHVTSYWYENLPERVFFQYNVAFPEAGGLQFALDTKEDFDKISNIFKDFTESHLNYNLKKILPIFIKK